MSITYDEKTMEVRNSSGRLVATWNDEAAQDYPEDLCWFRDIGQLVRESYLAGKEAQKAGEE